MLFLRPGLSYCDVGGRLVFLDTVADRYFCLDPVAGAGFRRIAEGAEDLDADSHRLDPLGLLTRSPIGTRPQACAAPPRPTRSLLDSPPTAAGFRATLGALASLQTARLRFRLQPLSAALAAFARAKRGAPARANGPDNLARETAGFRKAELFATTADACLSHSYAIGRHLIARRVDAALVLGVRLGPFAAHCWVQHGDCLVNDRLDMVSTFTPILAL